MLETKLKLGCMSLFVGATAFIAVADPALAQSTPVPCASAVDAYVETVPSGSSVTQYVEAVPTGHGPAAPGITKGSTTPTGSEPAMTEALKTVAVSPTYGAPIPRRTRTHDLPAVRGNAPLTTSLSESVRGAVGSLGTASDGRLLGLLAVVLTTTLGVIALATRASRR